MIHPNLLCQIELYIDPDMDNIGFYEKILGWQTTPAELYKHLVIDVPEDSHFGICLIERKALKQACNQSRLYFRVQNIDQLKVKLDSYYTKDHPITIRPSYGKVLLFSDPSGNLLGFFQRAKNVE